MCLKSFETSSGDIIFAKSEYSVGIEVEAIFVTNTAICALQEEWTSLFRVLLGLSREAT